MDRSYTLGCELSVVRAVEDFCFPTHCSRGERRQLLTLARRGTACPDPNPVSEASSLRAGHVVNHLGTGSLLSNWPQFKSEAAFTSLIIQSEVILDDVDLQVLKSRDVCH